MANTTKDWARIFSRTENLDWSYRYLHRLKTMEPNLKLEFQLSADINFRTELAIRRTVLFLQKESPISLERMKNAFRKTKYDKRNKNKKTAFRLKLDKEAAKKLRSLCKNSNLHPSQVVSDLLLERDAQVSRLKASIEQLKRDKSILMSKSMDNLPLPGKRCTNQPST